MATKLIALQPFTPKGAAPKDGAWEGGEYVSGELSATGLTTPGKPVEVKTKAYADSLVENKLAKHPDDAPAK